MSEAFIKFCPHGCWNSWGKNSPIKQMASQRIENKEEMSHHNAQCLLSLSTCTHWDQRFPKFEKIMVFSELWMKGQNIKRYLFLHTPTYVWTGPQSFASPWLHYLFRFARLFLTMTMSIFLPNNIFLEKKERKKKNLVRKGQVGW